MILLVQYQQAVMFGVGVPLGEMVTQTICRRPNPLSFGEPQAPSKLQQGILAPVSLRRMKSTAGDIGHIIKKAGFVAVYWAYLRVGVWDAHGQQPTQFVARDFII